MKSIGTDIFKNSRMTKEVMEKFLSIREKDLLIKFKSEIAKKEFASGRWAAKEAIIKASNKKITFSQIEILKSDTGAPLVYIDDKKRNDILISISHEKEYSIAMVVIE